ncbi:aldoxime dehydratase [Clohesyomyces aquaticus]|uniref:Aldoxime dehydratase n=1 Tax=Clohesyomyces aquaticus TaxID=1231657 RepID=A0A1Y1Z4T1_9PLEO|nr:aldoxime dehydratase [Clohesyomyces aquaticus]
MPNCGFFFPASFPLFKTSDLNLVLAIIGAQYTTTSDNDRVGILTIESFMSKTPEPLRPSFWEISAVVDKRGAFNIAVLAYWPNKESHASWEAGSGFGAWWESPEREAEGHGWFYEVLRPTVDRFETIFSNYEHPEGAANMQEKISEEIAEHGYWGSMRDRLAVAQNDKLEGQNWESADERSPEDSGGNKPKRVSVPGKKNLCVIRSGQDWSDTLPEERKLYLETMHPVLIQGMNFLRDEGRKIGCYDMNLWDVVDSKTYDTNRERTFGLGYFDDLVSLEYWSKSHKTHVDIFGGFLVYAKKLDNVISLRLFHEVYVLQAGQQSFEYIGCHAKTGMLNSLQAP